MSETKKITQNGKLDKRFKSTKEIKVIINNIKVTKNGNPDKRVKAVKTGTIKIKKDGAVKGSSTIGRNMKLL